MDDPRRTERWVLAATILGSSLTFIDATVVNVSLPALQRSLGASVVDVQWVVEAYALALASLLLVGGALGDRVGRRRAYAAGIVVFALASSACGLAQTIRQLVVARAVQGVGAALLVPGSLAIISASFPERERGRAIGTWSAFTGVATALGPLVGGWLIEHVSWRAAFFVNLPVATAVLGMLLWRVPESRDPDAVDALDVPGAVLVAAGLGGIVYALVESSRLGWRDARLAGALAGGVMALLAFVVVEARTRSPMVPLALFRSRTFAGANVLTLLLYGGLASLFFFLPMDLIQVHGYSATAAGAAGLPFIVTMSLLSRWSGGLIDRVGPRMPLVAGPLVVALGYALFALPGTGGRYWTTFFPAMLVLGLGMAVSVAPLTTTVMNAVDARHAGTASGINNAVSRIGGLLAIALMSVLVLRVFDRELDRRVMTVGIRRALAGERMTLAVADAFVAGFRRMTVVAAGLACLSALTAAAMIGGRDRRRRPGAGARSP
ncbi:MAG TPA: MFS transporter [Candidatus Binatia bacterium]|nr:MFS transporter [Candidatus Binatia bacterium]